MFNWFKKLLGVSSLEEEVAKAMDEAVKEDNIVEAVSAPKTAPKPKAKAKAPTKTTKKKTTGKSCDFDKLTKKQLLAEAKHRGVKANASMSKADILEKVKSAK